MFARHTSGLRHSFGMLRLYPLPVRPTAQAQHGTLERNQLEFLNVNL